MNASTTHDTKRSEDVRARINILSEIPSEWEDRVSRWAHFNAAARVEVDGDMVPYPNEEYLLYQTLVGAWPLEDAEPVAMTEFRSRIQGYIEKATREAKVNTSWITPNQAYDDALRLFVERILTPGDADPFINDMREFVRQISPYGMVNSLAQTLIKMCAPGLPDIYQGQEIWDFSLVDPDNRRPVDYASRRAVLAEIRAHTVGPDRSSYVRDLTDSWMDGRIKMYLTHLSLMLRRERPELFQRGEYLPLEVTGERSAHVFAFGRRQGPSAIVVAVPRLLRTLASGADVAPSAGAIWGDTAIETAGLLPAGSYTDLFTGAALRVGAEPIDVAALWRDFPVALLHLS